MHAYKTAYKTATTHNNTIVTYPSITIPARAVVGLAVEGWARLIGFAVLSYLLFLLRLYV